MTLPRSRRRHGVTDAKVGDLIETPDGDQYVVTGSGPVSIDGFAKEVYNHVLTPDRKVPRIHDADADPGVEFGDDLPATGWPADPPAEPLDGDPCARLVTEHDQAPEVVLGVPGEVAAVGSLAADRKEQEVETGHGAYVLSGSWADTDTGSPFAIDSKGSANPLLGNAASQLGYGSYPVVVVPDTWVKLFHCGVNLSQDAALTAPKAQVGNACT